MRSRILIDTAPLVGFLSEHDQYHDVCIRQLKKLRLPLYTCWPVITEAAWMLKKYPHVIQRMLRMLGESIIIMPLDNKASPWIADFMREYEDIRPQLADVCLVYLAEREGIDTIFTLDRRDFSIYRFKQNQSFNLIPAL